MDSRVTVLSVIGVFTVCVLFQANSYAANEVVEEIEEVTVTGTYTKKRQQADNTSPITVIGMEDLNAIGAYNAVDLINTLTVNSGAQNNSDGFNQTFSLGTTNVNLRGLGVSSTLVLLNSRRQTSSAAVTLSGDSFVDLNSLVPLIAIKRVEILEDGASSLYGSDAVAGVVNFITRSDFEGIELDVGYQTTTSDSQGEFRASGLFGREFGRAHVIAAFNYFNRDDLTASARKDEFEIRDAGSIFGQPGTFLPFGGPTAFLPNPDPSCATVAASDPNVTSPGPIGFCGFDFGDFFSLVADEERLQTYVEFNLDLTSSIEFFAEFSYISNKIVSDISPSEPILFPQVVPPNNPGNLFGAPALWFGRIFGSGSPPEKVNNESDTWRIATGLNGSFNENWSWQAAFTHSENDYSLRTPDTLVDRYTAALGGAGGPSNNLFFNPLFGATNDPAVIDDIIGLYGFDATAKLTTIDAIVSGDFFDLPAGSISAAFGIQYRDTELEYDYDPNAESDNFFFFIGNRDFNGSEDVYALFFESYIPVLQNLDIQLALRYEDFGDVDTLDPKVGFIWRPTDKLSIRGTFGTSFRSPSIFQTNGGLTVPARVFDPVVGALVTVSQRTEGDVSIPLTPQNSDTYNFGVTWSDADSGFTASLDYWRFDYTAFITPENANAVVAADPFGPQVVRDPITGTLLTVTTFFRNAGSLDTDGLDISFSKDFDATAMGDFRLILDATIVLSYDLDDPVRGKLDGKGLRNFNNFGVPMPELRGNLGLLWDRDRYSANVFLRYIDSYKDDNTADSKIENFTSVDIQFAYETPSMFGSEYGPVITVGSKNVFDKMPPDVVSRTGYDALTHNPVGRTVYLSLKQSF